MGVDEELSAEGRRHPADDDPGSPPGPATPAEDHPEPTELETVPMPPPSRQNRNTDVDFRGEKRSNAAHASTSAELERIRLSPGHILRPRNSSDTPLR